MILERAEPLPVKKRYSCFCCTMLFNWKKFLLFGLLKINYLSVSANFNKFLIYSAKNAKKFYIPKLMKNIKKLNFKKVGIRAATNKKIGLSNYQLAWWSFWRCLTNFTKCNSNLTVLHDLPNSMLSKNKVTPLDSAARGDVLGWFF